MLLRRNQNIIPILAICVLLIGTISTYYVNAHQNSQSENLESIIINDQSFDITLLYDSFTIITIETDDGEKTGISLSEIILSTDIDCPDCYSYTIIASDGYQQTINWEDAQKGILTKDKTTYFPHLAHSFWVHDIIQIEVKE